MSIEFPTKLQARINELELALVAADKWIGMGEGVPLSYYCEPCFGDNHLLAVIKEVLDRHGAANEH